MKLTSYIKDNKPSSLKKGHFTKAYLYNESNEVILESRCNVKEYMALGWFPQSSLFPAITFSELTTDKDEFKVYKMPLYTTNSRSVKSILCKEDYENIYLPLRSILYPKNYIDFKSQLISIGVSEEVIETIIEAYAACMNYSTDIGWEISPRNIAATPEGKLVLLDCFFVKSQLRWNH